MSEGDNRFRTLPSVNSVLSHQSVSAEKTIPRAALVQAIRQEIDEIRGLVSAGSKTLPDLDTIAEASLARGRRLMAPSPGRVINATGVVLHTNLGRAPLADAAVQAISSAGGYCDLEFDLALGERGSRHTHIDSLLGQVAAAESGMAVNNNAGAVLLVLTALAQGKEVIVSRGELVEIGGAFRVPDIMRQSGARLVEVGTTNRTRIEDYEEAIGPETAMILKVHTSNYRMVGFTESVDPNSLGSLAKKHGLLLFHDAGSGLMVDLEPFGLRGEPTVQSMVGSGCDVVAFSGDKLFGGPQAGLIVGRKAIINRVKRHPLSRALRLDKFTLGALSATLRIYAYGDPRSEIPVLRMLTASTEQLLKRAKQIKKIFGRVCPLVAIEVSMDESFPGGGSFPGTGISSPVVGLTVPGVSASSLVQMMRSSRPPIVARIRESQVLLDSRTLSDRDVSDIAAFLQGCVCSSNRGHQT